MRHLTISCLALLVLCHSVPISRAELLGIGDISDAIDPLGYGIAGQPANIGGDLIIGQTDLGGVFIDVAFGPGPLINTGDGILGQDFGSYGSISIDGFPSDWLIGGNLIIGQAGSADADLFDSAKIQVGDDTYNAGGFPTSSSPINVVAGTGLTTIGQLETGFGTLTMTNVASRLVTANLIVGDLGVGNITMVSRSTMFTADAYIGNGDGSAGFVSVSDLGTKWSVGNNNATTPTPATLTIGNNAGNGTVGVVTGIAQNGTGQGILRVAAQGLVEISESLDINALGQLQLQTNGRVRILRSSPAATAITNDGQIFGHGFIDFAGSNMVNETGIISNQRATNEGTFGTYQREKLTFTADTANGDVLTNNGLIRSDGGEMEFIVPVRNSGTIIARDAIMTFARDLDQTTGGTLVVGGNTTIIGNIISTTPATQIRILNNTIATVIGNLLFGEAFLTASLLDSQTAPFTSTLTMSIGDNPSSLLVTGNVNLSGATLRLDYTSTTAPTVGQSFELLSVAGDTNGLGTFANNQVVVDGKLWNIGYDADSVIVTYTGLAAGLPGDFDNDGDVDGRDFMVWQRNPSVGSLADWKTNYGQTGAITANVTAVPEPSAAMLMLAGVIGLALRRR